MIWGEIQRWIEVGAKFSLVLSVVITAFALLSLIKAFTTRSAAWIVSAAVTSFLCSTMIPRPVASAPVAGVPVSALRGSAPLLSLTKEISSANGSLTIKVPSDWRNAEGLDDEALIQAGNISTNMAVMVTGTRRERPEVTLDQLHDFIRQGIVANLPGTEVMTVEHLTIDSRPAILTRFTGPVDGAPTVTHITVVETAGTFYQITSSRPQAAGKEMDDLLAQITQSLVISAEPPPHHHPPAGR